MSKPAEEIQGTPRVDRVFANTLCRSLQSALHYGVSQHQTGCSSIEIDLIGVRYFTSIRFVRKTLEGSTAIDSNPTKATSFKLKLRALPLTA